MHLNHLFQSYVLTKQLTLQNKITMAPMTRNMADDNWCATEAMADYYARRSGAGLIVTEGTVIARDASGYTNVPGIFSKAQVAAWQRVTDKVHAAGGKIFSQIWHVGRISHPYFLNGQLPVGPSAANLSGRVKRAPHELYHGENRALTIDEIQNITEQFAAAASNAIQAGFDGVEIHGANGYLIDQFLHHDSNRREDDYGGTPEDMSRFALEVVQACCEAIGHTRVAIRLTPVAYMNEIESDPRDKEVFQVLLNALSTMQLAYVHTGTFDDQVSYEVIDNLNMSSFMRQHYQGNLVACGSYDPSIANSAIAKHKFDLIAFGRLFLANPDLVLRLQSDQPLRSYDPKMLDTLN